MRECTSKSFLKNAIKVEAHLQTRNMTSDARFLDGCAVLWVVVWPLTGIVQDYMDNFCRYLNYHVTRSDVYLIFDRYICQMNFQVFDEFFDFTLK